MNIKLTAVINVSDVTEYSTNPAGDSVKIK